MYNDILNLFEDNKIWFGKRLTKEKTYKDFVPTHDSHLCMCACVSVCVHACVCGHLVPILVLELIFRFHSVKFYQQIKLGG